MTQKENHNPEPHLWTSLSLFWDGIYNVDSIGQPIIPPKSPIDNQSVCYDCTRRFLKLHSICSERRDRIPYSIGCENIAVRIGDYTGNTSSGVAVDFTPYEQVLVIPIQILKIEQVNTLMLRIYRCVPSDLGEDKADVEYQVGKNENYLVYQEILDRVEIDGLQTIETLVLKETHSDFSSRIANYWGVEDFANWYHHTYSIEVWISIIPEAFTEANGVHNPKQRVGNTVHSQMMNEISGNGLTNRTRRKNAIHRDNTEAIEDVIKIPKNPKNARIRACDHLNYNYNFERRKDSFKWLSDFSRVQRLLRNQKIFFEYLRHIEGYLQAKPNAELLEALEFFEDQAYFPTTQAIPVGVLSSSCFSELVTRAYAIYDVGVRSCHGGLTHRFQWHAIIHLMTNRHTTAIAQGFYHSALELYCAARGSLFKTTNRPNSEFTIDLWRFLFDRFDKYTTKDSPQSALIVKYPEQYDDELHYAEQAYMALLDFPKNPRITQDFIMELGTQPGKLTSSSIFVSTLLQSNCMLPNKLHNWIEQYLSHLGLISGADFAVYTTDERLKWGCLISSDEWAEIDAELELRRIHFHNLSHIASKLRSFFLEAVVSVRVISELYSNPGLIPSESPHYKAIFQNNMADRPLANIFEEVAPYVRILSLLRQVCSDGKPLFSNMIDSEGNSIECLIKTDSTLLSQEEIDILKAWSRLSVKANKSDGWNTKGIAFF
ncbi:MAG TPA: hypothetical protein DCS91_10215 [Microcoleaceae bacterium UBA11344]|nr:hypothetical protein [Microcoleaceae cyanobacterium UBA11344]